MKNRIEYIIKSEALSNLQFANSLNISPASVTHVLSGRNNPSLEMVVRIAQKYPHYNLRWLLLGDGAVYDSNKEDNPSVRGGYPGDLFSTIDAQPLERPEPESKISLPTVNANTSNKEDATSAEQQKLIVCLPDGTYREYTKQ